MIQGSLRKMSVSLQKPIKYTLFEEQVALHDLIGKPVSLSWNGNITCVSCSKSIKKTFGDGFCYACFMSAPEAAPCIINPELCRAHLGEGRDVAWEERNHNVPHVVYFTLSDRVKVGITRKTQVPTRWIDQGAVKAIVIAETPNRYTAGVLEVALKSLYADKTNWQRMLKNEVDWDADLVQEKWEACDALPGDLQSFFVDDDTIYDLNYPVTEYPSKITTLTLDKMPLIEGVLVGIKGQYLLFDTGVFNVRRHTGYSVTISF